MSTTTRALWYLGPGEAELREHALEDPPAGTLRIRARFGALSRGTEALVYRHEVPPSEWPRMAAPFQRGTRPGPVSYGYVSVGEVEAGDPSRLGEAVFCLHPHHSRYLVPANAAIPIPSGVPPERAILAANQETALNALWDGAVLPGQRIQVLGAGVVGMLLARLAARIPGVEIELVDHNPAREPVARALGLPLVTPERSGAGFDRVFECSGSPRALEVALEAVRTEGVIVVVSWYGTAPVTVPLGADFHARRLQLRSSQVGRVSPKMAHVSHSERLALALRLLEDSCLDALVTDEVAFAELPSALPELLSEHHSGLCTRIVY